MNQNYNTITEWLLEAPYWVIDFLPMQVSQERRGQFHAVEQYFLTGERHERLRRQFAHVVLGLNCYYDLTVNRDSDNWIKNPAPTTLVAWLDETLQHGHLCALIDDGEWDTETVLLGHGDGSFVPFSQKVGQKNRPRVPVPVSHALLTASGGDTHLTLYNPSPGLLQLVERLATAAGLHVWQPLE